MSELSADCKMAPRSGNNKFGECGNPFASIRRAACDGLIDRRRLEPLQPKATSSRLDDAVRRASAPRAHPSIDGRALDLIQHVLRTFAEYADEALVTKVNEFQLGSLSVADEAVTVSPLLEFPQGHWRNDPEREAMIDALAVGHLRLPRQSWVL